MFIFVLPSVGCADAQGCCRSNYGALKNSELKTKAEATRFVDHLITGNILGVRSKRMERKEGQKFANTQNSIVVGDDAQSVESGHRQVSFVLQVRAPRAVFCRVCCLLKLTVVHFFQTKPTRAPAATESHTAAEMMPKPAKERSRVRDRATAAAAVSLAPTSPRGNAAGRTAGSVFSVGALVHPWFWGFEEMYMRKLWCSVFQFILSAASCSVFRLQPG